MPAATLEEAIRDGQGIERPFRCPKHEDRNASASVNVIKGVWFCYACNEKGFVDKSKKRTPTAAELRAMLEPEVSARVYPEAWLDLFAGGTYWAQRFPDWLAWYAALGEDPFSGQATFPVRTPEGKLAGVGRRNSDEAVKEAEAAEYYLPRYRYPSNWAASRVLHGVERIRRSDVLVLVEGAADQTSLVEIGVPAVAVYGSGLHLPQKEHILRCAPKLVLIGMDNDDAGHKGADRSMEMLAEDVEVRRVIWGRKDPADCTPDQRLGNLIEAVGSDRYVAEWNATVADIKARYQRHVEDAA